ncbi:MAG: hypothetical protein HDQ93_06630 [Desulfovibrio sp.]|nr:hypothetical protein [Desulfovibrio sp.]
MRFLFVSYASPGPLGPMAAWLARDRANQVIFAASRARQDCLIPRVQRVVMKKYQGSAAENSDYLSLWDEALRAGRSASASLSIVRKSGFYPDMIFNASSNGIAMGARNIYPDVFRVNFLEDENFARPNQAFMRRSMQCLQILNYDLSFAFGASARLNYPKELRGLIRIAPRMVDSAFFETNEPRPSNIVCIFCQNHEEDCARLCLDLLGRLPYYLIVVVAANSFVQRKLESLLPASERLKIQTVHKQDILKSLLKLCRLAVFPDNGGPILEALGMGAPVMLADKKAVAARGTLCLGGEDAESRSATIARALKNPEALLKKGREGREHVREKYGADSVMPEFFEKTLKAYDEWKSEKRERQDVP